MTFQSPRHILVTGGCGFIGSNFVRLALGKAPGLFLTNLDLLTYAGNLDNLSDVETQHGPGGGDRYTFVRGDIRDFPLVSQLLSGGHATSSGRPPIDAIVHFAAESHVDRSIMGPGVFVATNVEGTLALLEAVRAKRAGVPWPHFRFLHISTDEVYGSLKPSDPAFTEATPLAPNSPYAATKAGADLLVRSYVETWGFPAIITRCSNNYGPYQFPEKLIPLMITRAVRDEELPLYGDGLNVRDWIHVQDHVEALWTVLHGGSPGDVFNIGGECEVANVDIVHRVLNLLGKPHSLIRYVPDRPGHDRRYAMNIARIRSTLGWRPRHDIDRGLHDTIAWFRTHQEWWERVLSEAYRASAVYLKR